MEIETVKYCDIVARCKTDIDEILPDLPKTGTLDAWQDYADSLEDLRDETSDHAHESVQHWDWAIYTHYGWKILLSLPLEIEQQAEQEFFDCWGSEPIDSLNDTWDMASRIAFFALVIIFRETMEEMIDELLEMANGQIENLESVS